MSDARLQDELRELLGRRVAFGEPLARSTSLRVGGPADVLARVESVEELRSLLEACQRHGVPVCVLGAGFNTLVRDGGIRGVVVRLSGLRAITLEGNQLCAEAGATHTQITRAAADAGLAGLECTREREMADVVASVSWLTSSGEVIERTRDALRFRYRETELPRGAIVTGARFALTPDDPTAIRARMREQMAGRRATQPVDQPSCGSVFRNPPGDHAGRLIEAAGLKGLRVGGAEISALHANFVVTEPGATAADVLALIERARGAVRERFDIRLETEVRITGEET
jgi:UDP-N-acetylmuramate dehydrogenase